MPFQQIDPAIQRLNDKFFETSPGAYFRYRALALLQFDPEQARDLPAIEAKKLQASLEKVKQRLGPLGDTFDHLHETATAPDRGDTAPALDAFILAYHASESLVHNLLAFDKSRHGDSPWLQLSDRRRGRGVQSFHDQVKDLLGQPAGDLDKIVTTFLFGTSDIAKEALDAGLPLESRKTHAVGWVRAAARRILDDANGYNAAKHGLASTGGFSQLSMALSVGDASTEDIAPRGHLRSTVLLSGPTVETLETVTTENGQREWQIVTRYVDPVADIATTLTIAELLDAAWEGGRVVYTDQEGFHISVLVGATPAEVQRSDDIVTGVSRMPIRALPLDDEAAQEVVQRIVDGAAANEEFND